MVYQRAEAREEHLRGMSEEVECQRVGFTESQTSLLLSPAVQRCFYCRNKIVRIRKDSWSESEKNIIREHYGKEPIVDWLHLLPGKSWDATKVRAYRIGMKKGCIGNVKNRGDTRIYEIDDNFFSVPMPLSAYWAGFIAADGSIGDGYNRTCLSIALSWKDVGHLQKFRDVICPDKPIKKYLQNGNTIAKFVVNSSMIINNLSEIYNIVHGKSLTLLPPNITDEKLKWSYVAGYIDGDGSIRNGRDKKDGIRITGTLQISEWVMEMLDIQFPKRWGTPSIPRQDKRCMARGTKNVYSYSFGAGRAIGILDCIQKYDLPILERKWGNLNAKWENTYPFITRCRHSIISNTIAEWT